MTAIQFNTTYDILALEKELGIALASTWANHYNIKDYSGEWKSISLRSASGSSSDIYANYTDQPFKDTPLLAELPYLQSVLAAWKCEKESVRFLALYPGSEIKPHKDKGCSYQDGNFRLHIPVVTNNKVDFIVENQNYFLAPGTCWYMDFSKEHSVRNNGDTVRIHLVIDCLRNEWTDKIFEAHGYQDCEAKMSIDEVKQVIAQLETHQTEVANNLIKQLKADYGL
ncbi:aspartyl/asparaginyl beta-hydroxylase domain-containing protein [Pedobacter helvus]|uniref:Aspartyl/asparaginyl beta-hydroxylase domain-containing protein n=1 Tax=Pedobacter helvus TaxID=2563444 RepID=A0ABW9JKF6_9SPHI|nr:aspartyl/asparaginyl beta-hydroxylase domain-containing protein [Pedobacter ureilyticus]